jgi:hypothetical protein
MSAITTGSVAREGAPLAMTRLSAAPGMSPHAATMSWRLVRSARKPPMRMPTALPRRKAVSAPVASPRGASKSLGPGAGSA